MPEDFDFASLRDQVSDHFESLNTPTDSNSVPDAPAADPAAASIDAQPVQPAEFDANPHLDSLVTVKIDGKTERVPLREALSGYSRTADYTRKTQELAGQRAELERAVTAYMGEREQLSQFLNNRDLVREYYQRAFGEQMAQQSSQPQLPGPGDIPTVADVQQMLQSNIQGVRQWAENYIAQTTQEAETRVAAAQISNTIQESLGGLLQDPLLKSIPKADVLIRRMAQDKAPQNIEELREALRSSADELKAAVEAQISEAQKRAAVSRGKLTNGIEPPGGKGILPQPKSYVNKAKGEVDWKSIAGDAEAFINKR